MGLITGMKEGQRLLVSVCSAKLPLKLFQKCSVQEDHVLVGARDGNTHVQGLGPLWKE